MADNMFDFVRTLMDKGHTEEARELLAIVREQEKVASAERPDVWQRIRGLPHEVQVQVLDEAKKMHWGQRMERDPTEDDLWTALEKVQGADVEGAKKKKKMKGG